jgi:hypothetical protein
MLRLIMVLGALITVVGATGVFAVFTDRATGGENRVASGSRSSAADLQIATASLSSGNVICGQFVDDTDIPQVVGGDLQPTSGVTYGYACLRNNGAAALSIEASADALTDIDTACSGDEEVSGDPTCGGNQRGELSPALQAHIDILPCAGGGATVPAEKLLPELASRPLPIGTTALSPGAMLCLRLGVQYLPTTPEATIQIAQSDTVTWNFAFDGTAP